MKALQVTMVALPILTAACAQPAQHARQYLAASTGNSAFAVREPSITAALPPAPTATGLTGPATPDPGRQAAPTALKKFDSVFDAQYVRTASTAR